MDAGIEEDSPFLVDGNRRGIDIAGSAGVAASGCHRGHLHRRATGSTVKQEWGATACLAGRHGTRHDGPSYRRLWGPMFLIVDVFSMYDYT